MIESVKNLVKELKKNLKGGVNPSGIFRAKITKDLNYESGSYEINGSLLLKCKCGDKIYSPLDGIMVTNPRNKIIQIEHGHLFFDNKIRRVRTEFRNIKYIRMRENKWVDKLFECIRIKEGESIAAIVNEDEVIEFKLFIDNVSVDPEPFILASYF